MILSGRDLKLYIETGKLKIENAAPENFQQNGLDLVLDKMEFYGDHFYLGCTREIFEFPDDLMAFVCMRSTWARRGFMVPPTIVDAGFKGNLTLEIVKFGNLKSDCWPVSQPFAHLIFARTTGPCELYRGKYTDQRGITSAKE